MKLHLDTLAASYESASVVSYRKSMRLAMLDQIERTTND